MSEAVLIYVHPPTQRTWVRHRWPATVEALRIFAASRRVRRSKRQARPMCIVRLKRLK